MKKLNENPTLKHSSTGIAQCQCGAQNPFRSNYTYMIGQWVLGLRCPKCLDNSGQEVISLKEGETMDGDKVAEGRIEELERWALCAELSKDEQDELSALKRMLWLEVES